MIPAGKFQMGSPENEEGRSTDEGPQHEVTIAQPLAIMEAEVTVGQYAKFVKATGYRQKSGFCAWDKPGFDQQDSHPVVCVSWNDAQAYASWMSSRVRKKYRLLSESEWEYSARAGAATSYFFGNSWSDFCGYGNVGRGNKSCPNKYNGTSPVKSYKPNNFGLYDVLGNASEWTQDCWHDNYSEAPSGGGAWDINCKESRKVVRGGAWDDGPLDARSARRAWIGPSFRYDYTGFRLARILDK